METHSNKMQVYLSLHEEMINKRKADDDDKTEEAEHVAHVLLSYADVPLWIRARAYVVLAHSIKPGYVEWARESVRIVELGITQMRSEGREPGPDDRQLLWECQETLNQAEARQAQQDLEGEGADDEAEEEEEDEGGELVYTDEAGWISGGPKTSTGDSKQTEVVAPSSKKSRRIDSSRDVEQEYDEETGVWVDVV